MGEGESFGEVVEGAEVVSELEVQPSHFSFGGETEVVKSDGEGGGDASISASAPVDEVYFGKGEVDVAKGANSSCI